MHGHGTELSPLRVKVEALPHPVAPVAALLSQPVNEGDANRRTRHESPPPSVFIPIIA